MKLPSIRLLAIVATALLASVVLAEHTSNWAVLVCTSRFWFNYRHLANVLSMYRTVKRLGIPDSQIILMLPDDMACNPRNAFPGTVYSNSDRAVDLYGDNIEVDYRGYEVTVENFIRLLTDRVGNETPRSKRLLTDDRSNILVYMTGHGGNEFLKFQDAEEIGAFDLADAFEQMWEKKRYHEILFMIDTCQANTMYSRLYSPNIIATGSSELDESSYSHHADSDVGVAVIDRYTYYNLEFLESHVQDLGSKKTVGELFDSYEFSKIHSNAGVRYDLFPGGETNARSRLITDFFGNIQNVEVDQATDLAMEEELLNLSKTIALLREKEVKEYAAWKNTSSMPASAPTEPPKKIRGAMALTDDNWWTKKVARPLQSLSLTSRPLSPHALAWSCDAELAVATAECIYIFLPEYISGRDGNDDPDVSQHQFMLSLQPSAIVQPNQSINAQLCAQAGVKFPEPRADEDKSFRGVGNGVLGGSGSALGQVVRVEWSPNGLGCNLRPILMGLTTNGSVIAFELEDALGFGSEASLPDPECEGGFRNMNERITSFSWAKEIFTGRALLAYATDAGEISIMSVQYFPRQEASKLAPEEESIWNVTELGRFEGQGPHGNISPVDPDFVPHGSIFSLKWSPWLVCEGYRSATLAYIAKNFVGFRRVTIYGDWDKGEIPNVVIEESNTTGMCLFLSNDAFVEWEDAVWTERDAFIARGVIATPFVSKLFQVALNGALSEPMQEHSPWECSSMYPREDELSTNPITGLVIHQPDPYNKLPIPHYSTVRLSATATNMDWYQTTLPEEMAPLPQWAEDLGDQTARLVPRGAALEGIDSDFDSDSDDGEDKMVEDTRPQIQVHPHRFRLWGLALSPGGGCSALLSSKQSTQHPNRRGFCNIHFDWQVPGDEEEPQARAASKPLTTEGKIWEWMYGMGEEVPGATSARRAAAAAASNGESSALREQFRDVAARLACVFCNSRFRIKDDEAICENGHPFATCAASGIPIMAPGVSRVCGVCKLRCLKVSELEKLAREYLGSSEGVTASSGEVCGGCGGKFVV
ncbi:GPI-anchor transamidase [Cladobotryum mycophilum]|uniref:GPI-anchor transamidase n=1 Tax=Cladobotryum mycophilum TaxID=491253 RepID=A0ABR0T1P0_9HYPO